MLLGQSSMCSESVSQEIEQSRKTAKCLLKELEDQCVWSFLKMATCFFASLAAAPLSRAHQPCCGLHGVMAAFWLPVFVSVLCTSLLALSFPLPKLSWQCVVLPFLPGYGSTSWLILEET